MDFQRILFTIAQCAPGFLLAIVVHEWAHGYMAKRFGDLTAEKSGRLTFNPMAHIDPVGTVFLPLFGIIAGFSVFGWAKPVPVDSRNFKNFRKGIFWVSFAGPLANFILMILSAFFYALLALHLPQDFAFYSSFLEMLKFSILINIILGIFNLIPLLPLDGGRMMAAILKGEALRKFEMLGNYTMYILWGLVALSLMGIPIFGKIFMPFIFLGQLLTMTFLHILS